MTNRFLKTLSILTLLSHSLVTVAQELPTNAKSLRRSYDQAMERATAPITAKYLSELGRLKLQAEKAKDGQSVEALNAEIERVEATATAALNDAEAIKTKITQGTWVGISGGLARWTLVFDATGKITMTKPDGLAGFTSWSWKLTDQNEIQLGGGAGIQTVKVSKRIDEITFTAGNWGTIRKQR